MGTLLVLNILVLGYLSFMVLFWLPCHVKAFEESLQVRWHGGQALCPQFCVVGGSKGGFDLAGGPE